MDTNPKVTKMGMAMALFNHQPLRDINGVMVMDYVFDVGHETTPNHFWVEGFRPNETLRTRVIVHTID